MPYVFSPWFFRALRGWRIAAAVTLRDISGITPRLCLPRLAFDRFAWLSCQSFVNRHAMFDPCVVGCLHRAERLGRANNLDSPPILCC